MPEAEYRSDPALSTSELKYMAVSPLEFHAYRTKQIAFERSESMRLGTLFHLYALQRDEWDKQVITCPDEFTNRRLKVSREWWAKAQEDGKEVVKDVELQAIQRMFAIYTGMPGVRDSLLRNPRTEVSVFAKGMVKNIDVKCRVDLLDGDTVIDIKTTAKGMGDRDSFRRSLRQRKYHWQQYNYTRILKEAGIEVKQWIWAVIETSPPYNHGVYITTGEDLKNAEAEVANAYRNLASCLRLGAWPSYTPTQPELLSKVDF